VSEKEAAPPKPRPSRLKRLFIRLAVITAMVGVVGGLAGYLFAENLRHQDGPHDEAVLVTLDLGDGRFSIKHKLFSAGVISHPLHLDIAAFMAWGCFRPLAGEYRVPPKASLVEIIALFNSGKTYQRRLTIIEGWRGYEVMQAINSAEGLGSVILRPPEEGSVFPDTYYYTKGMDRRELLARMQAKMELELAQIWADRQAGLPYASPQDLLIMASIIEKEAASKADRQLVAAVLVNRMKRGMRLQSDPTVRYGIDVETDRPISKADLRRKTPWNTYVITGLPKTPICNPGFESIEAALHPADSDFLYFVSDGFGGLRFAKTLDVHNKNVRLFRAIEAQNPKGSKP